MDRRRRGTLLASALIAAACALAPPTRASAQPPQGTGGGESMSQATTTEGDMNDERARGAFRLGRQYYEQGRFAEAASEFERAYGLSGRGQLLFNAYLAYRDARDDENAIRTLRGYLAQVEEIPDRALLEARLAALERGLAERRESDARAAAETEEARRQAEEARRQAEEAGRPRYREVPGETWPWIVMGSGGALVVAGIVTGAVALSERSALDDECPLQLCPAGSDVEGRQSTIEALAITTDVLLVTGTAAAVAGLVLGLVLGPRTEAIETPPVSAACTGEGCFVAVRGDF
ncbi:tetratricopeptide repeat protein [Sandaracinus amylolyticus]|uniref:tetratricopeptide repeat protein n=1 Tax=Sandaracinus amylolyticus TaxID=927083 RepID=UPI001F368454|nr:tetratricopeptide repeat protein [Sandaracinus amylolyticus]